VVPVMQEKRHGKGIGAEFPNHFMTSDG